jgi:hypothetical protein
VKFYLDEDLDPRIAVAGRALGVDVISAHERSARGITDEEQLARAAAEGRCIVTFNRNDFLRVTRQAFDKRAPHCGVLIIPPRVRYGRHGALAALLAKHAAKFPEDRVPAYSIALLTK